MPDTDADNREEEKECPLCYETMHLKSHKQVDHIPGTGQTVTRVVKEWVCPDCSYQEEFEEE